MTDLLWFAWSLLPRPQLLSQEPTLFGRDAADAGPWDVIKTLSGDSIVHHADFANQIWCRRDLHLLLQHGWDAMKRPACTQQSGTPFFELE